MGWDMTNYKMSWWDINENIWQDIWTYWHREIDREKDHVCDEI